MLWGLTCDETPSNPGGSRNTPSHFMLQKLKLSVEITGNCKLKGPFTQAIFCAIFVARKLHLQIVCVNGRRFQCDLGAICCAMSLMQLGGDFWKITAKQSKYRTRIAQEIAASLHLGQKLHRSVREKSHQKSHV